MLERTFRALLISGPGSCQDLSSASLESLTRLAYLKFQVLARLKFSVLKIFSAGAKNFQGIENLLKYSILNIFKS